MDREGEIEGRKVGGERGKRKGGKEERKERKGRKRRARPSLFLIKLICR